MINIIYGLRDPRNDVYQYIGKSTVGINRPLQHLAHSHSPKVNEWVRELLNSSLCPIIDIIEEVEDINNLAEQEKYWINYYYDINPSLLNVQFVIPSLPINTSEDDESKFYYLSSIIQNIPIILKRERIIRGLTQEVLSKEMGVSISTISLCERGENVVLKTVQLYIRTLKGIDILRRNMK